MGLIIQMHDLLLLIGFPSKIDGVWKEGVAFRRPAKIDGVWKEGVAFRRPATAAASRWRQINDDVTIMMTRQHGVAAEASGFILKTAPSLSAFLIPTSPVFFLSRLCRRPPRGVVCVACSPDVFFSRVFSSPPSPLRDELLFM